ncbi:unnamed protein product [Meganyctiphanes norvegica]|uniref:G-protein coupled receptors family 1 profile domain-containing protein n=1 Tax=Meganyctiphanes norvegica TaxID=48144 RepID=A0AAV2PJD3_MEGNR
MDETVSKMFCNDTCCTSSKNFTFCFIDHNFTEKYNFREQADWEVGARWGISIPLALLGFCGNFITIFLLLRNRLLMRSSVNHFILNMAVADLILSLAGPIPTTIRFLNQFWVLGEVWCHMDGFIQMTVMLVSMTSLATISIDRMLGVARPWHRHLNSKQSCLIVISIWIYAFFMATPFGIYRVYRERQWYDFLEITCTEVQSKTKIWWIIENIALVWLPLIILLISNCVIFISFKKFAVKVRGKEHPAMIHMKKRVIKMMFVMVLLFTIMWIPFQISGILDSMGIFYSPNGAGGIWKPGGKLQHDLWMNISQYLIYVNPVVNPIVYALMHQNFRRAYRTTCTCCFKSKPKFFLSKGDGERPFVWSMSGFSDTYNVIIRSIRRQKRGESRPRLETVVVPVLKHQHGNHLMVPEFPDVPQQPDITTMYNNKAYLKDTDMVTATSEESSKKSSRSNTAIMINELFESENLGSDSERVL